MKAKNMYQFLDGLYHRNKNLAINGEQISPIKILFLKNNLLLCKERDISINDLRNELERDYNNTLIKSIRLEKKLLEFLLKI